MNTDLKKLQDQTIVITGASSGIGLATARMAAERGARVVLCSRNKTELEAIASEINSSGEKRAVAVECDVADPEAVQRVADTAVQEFGGFDTWVNNAGVSIYGKLTETHLDEKRKLFDTNFWGVVHGCRSAVKHLREKGGAIINVGSVVSDVAIPVQGIYSVSKHAVQGYTNALRRELEADQFPISVTLIKPGSIDTPFTEHALNKMDHHPELPPPVYSPDVVARAILEAAEKPVRDVSVGGSSKLMTLLDSFLPRFFDIITERTMGESSQSSAKKDDIPQDTALHRPPAREGQARGHYQGRVLERSAYTAMSLKPQAAALIATGLGLATAAGIGLWQQARRSQAGVAANEGSRPETMTH